MCHADIPEVSENIAEEIPAGGDPVSEKEDQPRAEESDRDEIKRREAAIGEEVLGRDAAGTESNAGEGGKPDTDESSGLHEGISAVRRYFLYVKVILSQCDGTEIRPCAFFIRLDPAGIPGFQCKDARFTPIGTRQKTFTDRTKTPLLYTEYAFRGRREPPEARQQRRETAAGPE